MNSNSSDAYLDWSYRLISSIIWVPLALLGIGGNLMVILVVMTVRGMKTPTNCYLMSLAAADFLFFFSSTPVELSGIHLPEDVFLFGRIGCSIFRFLPFLSMNASSLSITAFTVERYIGICHPMKARYLCTVKRAQLIIVILWSSSIAYNSTWLFLTDLKPLNYTDWPDAYQCTFSLSRASYKTIFLLDIFIFYVVPLLAYLILYGRMARILIKARFFQATMTPSGSVTMTSRSSLFTSENTPMNQMGSSSQAPSSMKLNRQIASLKKSRSAFSSRSKMDGSERRLVTGFSSPRLTVHGEEVSRLTVNGNEGKQPSPIAGNSHRNLTVGCGVSPMRRSAKSTLSLACPSSVGHCRGRSWTKMQFGESKAYGESLNKARVQVVKMLIVIVVVFALFWLPYRGLVVYNSFTKKPWIEKWYLLFAKTMVMVNCAINPVLYNLMSGKFRGAFQLMFKRCFRGDRYSSRFNSDAPSTLPNPGVSQGLTLHNFGLKVLGYEQHNSPVEQKLLGDRQNSRKCQPAVIS